MSSVTARVFKGCRVLLAPAASASKSSSTAATAKLKTTTTTTTATSTINKPKAKAKAKAKSSSSETPTMARPTGISKVSPVSTALGHFVGASEASRSDVVKKIWAYIKTNNLQNPTDKREIFCDEKLKALFDGKDKVGFLEIGKLLNRHFVKTN